MLFIVSVSTLYNKAVSWVWLFTGNWYSERLKCKVTQLVIGRDGIWIQVSWHQTNHYSMLPLWHLPSQLIDLSFKLQYHFWHYLFIMFYNINWGVLIFHSSFSANLLQRQCLLNLHQCLPSHLSTSLSKYLQLQKIIGSTEYMSQKHYYFLYKSSVLIAKISQINSPLEINRKKGIEPSSELLMRWNLVSWKFFIIWWVFMFFWTTD